MHSPSPMAWTDTPWMVLSVLTTPKSGKPTEAVEVVCLRIQHGEVQAKFHTRIRPHAPLSEEFIQRQGWYDAMLKDAPVLEEAIASLAQFIGRDWLVWTHAPSVPHTVYQALHRSLPHYRQRFLQPLAEHCLPALSAHTPTALARHWQWTDAQNPLSTEAHATLCAKILLQLFHVLETTQPVSQLSELFNLWKPLRPIKRQTRAQLAFNRDKLKQYPLQPGVYFMKNQLGEILYIGKAKCLRNRLRSYFQKQSRLPPKIAAMMRQVAMIDVEVVGSELEALLLEAKLIKHHQPFFNQKIKNYQSLFFLQISAQEHYPALTLTEDPHHPEAIYFGPFSGHAAYKSHLDVLNRIFKLRSCTDRTFARHHQAPCMQYELGLCSGPCAGLISQQDYQRSVQDFLCYMSASPASRTSASPACEAMAGLIAKRDAYTEQLQFEKAAAIQAQLLLLEQIQAQAGKRLKAIEQHHCLLVLPNSHTQEVRLLGVLHGQPIQWRTLPPHADSQAIQALLPWIQTLKHQLDTTLENTQANAASAQLPRIHIEKADYEESRLIGQWLEKQPPNPSWHVIYLAPHSPIEILKMVGEFLQHAYGNPPGSRLPDNPAPNTTWDEDDEAWHWEMAHQENEMNSSDSALGLQ